jgi:hypothetical protein
MITPFDLMDGLALAITLGLLAFPVGLLDEAYPDQDWSERIQIAAGSAGLFMLMLIVLVSAVWGVLTGFSTVTVELAKLFFG